MTGSDWTMVAAIFCGICGALQFWKGLRLAWKDQITESMRLEIFAVLYWILSTLLAILYRLEVGP
jgi:ADP-ribosylglycohydrolase